MEPRQANFTLAASGDKAEIDVRGLNTLGIQIVGTLSATLQFEGTIDGKNWFALYATPTNSNTPVSSTTAAGVWFANVSGLIGARVRCSGYTSGSPTIAIVAIHSGSALGAGATNGQSVTISAIQALIAGIETNSILFSSFRRSDAFHAVYSSADASTAAQVLAATAAKQNYLTDVVISTDTAMNVKLQDDTGTPVVLVGPIYLPANSVWSKTFSTPIPFGVNKKIMVKASVAGNISVTADGYTI